MLYGSTTGLDDLDPEERCRVLGLDKAIDLVASLRGHHAT